MTGHCRDKEGPHGRSLGTCVLPSAGNAHLALMALLRPKETPPPCLRDPERDREPLESFLGVQPAAGWEVGGSASPGGSRSPGRGDSRGPEVREPASERQHRSERLSDRRAVPYNCFGLYSSSAFTES